jgi:outer membrane protein assembly factor BamB
MGSVAASERDREAHVNRLRLPPRSARLVLGACAAALVALAGCGGGETVKPSPLPQFKPTADARVAWRTSVGSSKEYVFFPALRTGAIFAAGYDGYVTRLDAANGKQAWRVDTKVKLSGGAGADEDLVLVGSDKGVVIALSLEGKERWRSQVTSEVLSVPRQAGNLVIVRSGDGRIFGLDAAKGERKWEYQATMPPLVLRDSSGVTPLRELILAGLPAGKLIALNPATGVPTWDAVVAQPKGANELERVTDVASAPVVNEDQACAVAFQGRIACYDATKGTLQWSRDASSAAGLAVDATSVYMTEESGVVMAYDKASGATLWKQDKLLARRVSGPAVVGSLIVVGDLDGYVHFLERTDGAFVARISTDGSAISAPPLRVGSNVLVQTRGGGIYAIAIKTK